MIRLLTALVVAFALADPLAQLAPPPTSPSTQIVGAPAAQDPEAVEVEYDRTHDFGRYKTFAWAPFFEPVANQTNQRLITGAIERALVAKGFVKSTSAQADLYVNAWGKIDSKVKPRATSQERQWDMGGAEWSVTFDRSKVGTLAIEFWDGLSKQLVWRAKHSEAIRSSDLDPDAVNGVVGRMLQTFPPEKEPQG